MAAELVRGVESPPQADGLQPLERREMRVRDAGPFLQLLSLPLSEEDSLEIRRLLHLPSRRDSRDGEVLKKIADVSSLVSLLQDALLPSLRRAPADAAQLLIMDACAHKLKVYARAVGGGGSFTDSCVEFAQRISSYTADARGGRGGRQGDSTTDVSLRDSLDDLLLQAARFLDMTYVPEDEAEAEGGGDY